ncbi:MAG: siroheme synthase CysG [Hyphomicrobiaceae bacterium]
MTSPTSLTAVRKPTDSSPPRLRPLAKLPLFFDLTAKRVVVAGGTSAAAWKAELLAAAGADVQVFALNAGDDMRSLIANGAAAGHLNLHERHWQPGDLTDAVIAVADLETPDEADTFRDAARQAGANVNIIDKPAYCDFQFGSIVNRSPVVIGISTDGAAPILGQAIRRRIETLLPPALADWARLAKTLRKRISQTLTTAPARRRFWEHLSDRAFGPPPGPREPIHLCKQASRIAGPATAATGRVTLVGAGPGNAEHLTLKAVRALQSADVILFDDLVSDEVLELARREARRMLVGKRGGRASCRQDDINALMIKLAGQGRHVVRLKSGDPMVFGRAGEEIEALRNKGIPVSVVPGITTASAMASALNVSLTNRRQAHSVRFVTGHSRHGGLPDDLDWRGLADKETSLVVYMGARTAPAIAGRLIGHGLSPDTPVAIVAAVTRPNEQRWHGSLGTIANGVAGLDISQPVILGIGDVFAQAQEMPTVMGSPATSLPGTQKAAVVYRVSD